MVHLISIFGAQELKLLCIGLMSLPSEEAKKGVVSRGSLRQVPPSLAAKQGNSKDFALKEVSDLPIVHEQWMC